MALIDQSCDPAYAVLLCQARRLPAFADFVKEAELDSARLRALPDRAFAWPEERRFPIDSDKQAAISYAYALYQPQTPTDVLSRLKEALEIFGVAGSLFELPGTKVAEEPAFLLPDLKLFPAGSAEQVKTSERTLLESLSKLDVEHRAEACTKLAARASAIGVRLHPETMRYAGLTTCSTKCAADWLEARSLLASDERHKGAYQKLAGELRLQPEELRDRETLVKLAGAVAALDEQASLARYYDRKLPCPLATIFNTHKESASAIDLGGGKLVPLAKLAALPAAFWEDLGGPELCREVAPGGVVDAAKLAAVLSTLPLDLKQVLRSQVGA